MKKECIAMLLAGGQGSRLYALTSNVAKPNMPFGGKYRIIDFPLSNCVNSGIYTVGVLTQYQPLELNDYVGNGEPWDLDRTDGGVHVLSPYQQIQGTDWYKGTANAIYQNIHFIDKYREVGNEFNNLANYFNAGGMLDVDSGNRLTRALEQLKSLSEEVRAMTRNFQEKGHTYPSKNP